MINSLTGKQVALFCSIMIFSSKLLLLPSLFYEANLFGSFLCLFFLILSELIFLYIIIKIKLKYKNISLFNFISQKIGKILTKIIFILLIIFFFLKIIYSLQECFSYLKQTLYTEATILIFLICVLPVITACVYKGLKSFGRTLEIFYVVIIVALIICTFIWITSVSNFSFSFVTNKGLTGFINGFLNFSFWFGDFFFIMLFIDKIRLKKSDTKIIFTYTIISGIILLFFYFSYFYIYQTSAFVHINAITDIIQFATNIGSVGKLDIVAITVIMFLLFFESGLYLFCIQECFNNLIPFRHKAQPLIISNFAIIISMYVIFNNTNNLVIFYSTHLKYFSIFMVFILPIILLLFLINYNKNNKNNKKINKNNNYLIKNKLTIKLIENKTNKKAGGKV